MEKISEAAQAIFAARRSQTPLGQLPAVLRPNTEAEAYRVQDAVPRHTAEVTQETAYATQFPCKPGEGAVAPSAGQD
jgi:2-keto-4-pentenoate hydratase